LRIAAALLGPKGEARTLFYWVQLLCKIRFNIYIYIYIYIYINSTHITYSDYKEIEPISLGSCEPNGYMLAPPLPLPLPFSSSGPASQSGRGRGCRAHVVGRLVCILLYFLHVRWCGAMPLPHYPSRMHTCYEHGSVMTFRGRLPWWKVRLQGRFGESLNKLNGPQHEAESKLRPSV
jgi:hypothetical protein